MKDRDAKRRRCSVGAGLVLVALLLVLAPAARAQASDVTVTGTFGDDQIVVTATSTDSATITLNGVPVHSGSVGALHVDGGAGDDTLTIENPAGGLFAPAGGIDYHGGPQSTQAGDSLEVHGGAADTSTDTAGATRDSGTLTHARGTTVQTIRYDGIEPTIDTVAAATLTINGTSAAETIGVDDGSTTGDGQIRVTGSDFESVEFANKTSVTVNGLGGDDTFNIRNSDQATGLTGDMKIDGGGQTGDAFTVGPANYTGGGLLLVDAGGGVTDANAGTDVTASRFGANVGTGVGTSLDPLDTAVSNLEASTTTGGIFVGNTGSVNVGGVSASLTGLTVATSGNITLTNSGSISLVDTDGLQVVTDGSTSGDVTLIATGATSDISDTVDEDAVSAPHGSVTLVADHDVLLGTVGTNHDNDVRANSSVFFQAGRTVTVDGFSDVASDDFGNNTGGSVTVHALAGDVNVTKVTGDDASVAAEGTAGAGVLLQTGAGGTVNLTAPVPAASSQSGSVTTISDHIAIDSASGIQASGTNGFVALQTFTPGTNADLGATVDTGFDLSDAELDTITTPILRVFAGGGSIAVSSAISPANATNLSLQATSAITQSGSITATGLQARSDAATVTLTNPANEVTSLAGQTHGSPGSNFTYVDATGVTVTTVDGQNGITTDDGDITVTAGGGGALTLSQPITATGSHQTILSSDGSATQAAAGNITSAGLKLTGFGSFDFENSGNAVGVLAGNPNGAVTFSQGANLTIGTVGGTDGVSTGPGKAVNITAAGADLTVAKNVAAGAAANLSATGADHRITNVAAVSGLASTFLADRMVLGGGTINVGGGTVSIAVSSSGRQIDLGSTTDAASGKLELSDAELDTITAGTLDVGSTTNGDITFTAPISPASAGLLILITGGSVVDGNPGTDVTVSKLAMKANGNVGLSGAIDTAVSNLEASGPGGVFVANSGAMTIGGVTGLLSGINGGAGGVGVSNDADITVSEGVTSTSTTSLSATGSEKRITDNSSISGDTLVSLTADQMTLAGGTTSSTSSVALAPATASQPIDLGSTVDTAGALRLSDAELDTITAPLLTTATTGTGTGTVSSAITLAPAKVPTLFISAPGGFTESAPLSVHSLRLDGGGVSATQANDVDNLAGAVTGASGNYSFTDANGLTTGAVAGESGVSTAGSGGKITLDTGGALTINQGGLNAGAGDGKITSGGAVTQDVAVGAVTINHLELLGAGPYTLTNALNNVDTLSGNVTGALNVVDKDQLTIATAGGTSGLHTSNAPISVTALNGQLLSIDNVDAGNAAIALRAAGTDRLLHLEANVVGGSATLTGDKFTYDGIGIANVGTGSGHDLQIQPDSAGRPIDLGSTSDPSGSMNVSDAELDKITANTITLGRSNAGLFTVSQPVSPASATLLSLLGGGGFTNGGSGSLSNGLLALSDGSSTARTWTLAPGSVSDGHAAIPYSGASNLSVNGGSGADTFNVKASPDATYAIDGGAPTSSPGDTLNYDAEARPVSGDSSPPDGDISTPGRKDVTFANIEAVNLLRANNNADLSTSVSDSPDPVNAGGVVTYHMHTQNGGPLDASQPRLTVPIPSGTKLVGAGQTDGSAFHCTSDGTTVTCAAASLASGGSAAIDMAVKTARSQQGTIVLHPSVSSSTSDADHSNDASSETTTVIPAPTGVTIGRTVTKRRSGSITVAIGCQGFPAHRCTVTVTVSFRPPHDDLAPITARKTIKAGRRSIVFLIASRSERRRIKRISQLPVHVAVTNRNGSGATRNATASAP